jgi:hypothetical protein
VSIGDLTVENADLIGSGIMDLIHSFNNKGSSIVAVFFVQNPSKNIDSLMLTL